MTEETFNNAKELLERITLLQKWKTVLQKPYVAIRYTDESTPEFESLDVPDFIVHQWINALESTECLLKNEFDKL